MREFRMASTGGGTLRCGIWVPAARPRAVVQLVHGIAEHIGRYDELGHFLTGRGMVLVADDHMGHGLSVGPGEVMGFFPSGWLGAVDDEKALLDRVRPEYPGTPYFLLGHSMGSFLTRTFLYRHKETPLSGAVLSGTGWQSPLTLAFGLRLCAAEEKKHGERAFSDVLENLVFGAYNRKFRPVRTPHDWICSDSAVVDAYCADPLCGFRPTIGLAREMLKGMQMNEKKENLAAMPKALPVLIFSGAKDPVGAMGKGVQRTARAFRAAGLQDVTCTLYPDGRHEMFNEPNREAVMEDVARWLEARLS